MMSEQPQTVTERVLEQGKALVRAIKAVAMIERTRETLRRGPLSNRVGKATETPGGDEPWDIPFLGVAPVGTRYTAHWGC